MMLSSKGSDRRCPMAITVQQIHPVAHLPLVLGVLRRLEVATLIDGLIPPHPAHGLSCGRGVEALVLAILDGHHALYKVGKRLEERGMVTLLQPGLTRAALNDYRLGHILDALFAANLNQVFSAVALKALEVYAIPTPWLHQDTTTILLYGAYADEPKSLEAPHPAYGHSKDGRDDLKQVLLSLGVSGDGGLPLGSGHLCVKPPSLELVQARVELGQQPLAARGSPIAEPASCSNRGQGHETAVGRTKTNSPGPSRSIAPAVAGLWGPRSRAGLGASGDYTSGTPPQ